MVSVVEDDGNRVQFRVTGTGTSTVVVVGNNSVSGIAAPGETVKGATISQVFWASDAAVTVSRGANTIFALPAGVDHWDFRAHGFSIGDFSAASLVVTTMSANTTVIVELTKRV